MVLFDCWSAKSKPAGTARTQNTHAQLRSRKDQFGGKKSKDLKAEEVGEYREAIARGQAICQLEAQIEALQERVEHIEAIAQEV